MGHIVKSLSIMFLLVACNPAAIDTIKEHSNQTNALSPLPDIESQLEQSLAEELGRTVSVDIENSTSAGRWLFTCGRPLETNGQPFDYETSRLSSLAVQQLIDDYFCALAEQTPRGFQMRELAVATTDAPIVDWIEAYNLPAELFTD